MALAGLLPAPATNESDLLRLAAAVESGSEHPIAAAITSGARARLPKMSARLPKMVDHQPPPAVASDPLSQGGQPQIPDISDFSAEPGRGVHGQADGHAIQAGRADWLTAEWALTIPESLAERADEAERAGQTAVFVAWDGAVRGLLAVADTVKPAARDAVSELRALGLHPVLLTGDNERAAHAVAKAVGIDDVIAGVLPSEKVDVIKQLQADGRTVAMVGDGVNDAAALAQADLGLAMGTGTDAAIEAADLTLVSGDPRAIPDAIRLSRRTLAIIKGNLAWAFCYNVAAIPLAAAGLLNPLIAAAAMAFSSVFVVTNSLRLRRFTGS
jgi:Cu+-exporting ATPase